MITNRQAESAAVTWTLTNSEVDREGHPEDILK